MSMKSERART